LIDEAKAVRDLFPEARLTIISDFLDVDTLHENTIRTDANVIRGLLESGREMQGDLPELSVGEE